MKYGREEYINLMTYGEGSRPFFSELFGPIIGLDREWRLQGASEEQINMTAFSFDYVPYHGIGNTGPINMLPSKTIEDTPDTFLGTDGYGRRVRMDKHTATIALPETWPVSSSDDWLKIKYMFEYDDCRITDEAIERAKKLQNEGTVIVANFPGGYDILRELMGDEGACLAFYDEPELVSDIFNTIADTSVKVFERIADKMTVDQISVHEDMAGKSGPLVGPAVVDEFIAPYYKRCIAPLKESGTKLVCQDSDGNMNPDIDSFIEAGVNIFYPCEPAAGMDIVQLRKKYGRRIAFRGGIDKHVLRRTKADIDAELEYKLQPCMREGIVFGLDHRITNGTPFENYVYYIDRAREILGLPDFRSCPDGWGRMAF